MVPPCFSINIIYHEFITYIKMHHHTVAIIYLFLISIGQKLICQLYRLLEQQLARGLQELLEDVFLQPTRVLVVVPLHWDTVPKHKGYPASAGVTLTVFNLQISQHVGAYQMNREPLTPARTCIYTGASPMQSNVQGQRFHMPLFSTFFFFKERIKKKKKESCILFQKITVGISTYVP